MAAGVPVCVAEVEVDVEASLGSTVLSSSIISGNRGSGVCVYALGRHRIGGGGLGSIGTRLVVLLTGYSRATFGLPRLRRGMSEHRWAFPKRTQRGQGLSLRINRW